MMYRRMIILSLTLVFGLQRAIAQSFEKTVSKYFFNANLNIKDSSLISFFETNPLLSTEADSMATTFNLEDISDSSIQKHFYGFSTHPNLPFPFRNGRISFTTIKTVNYLIYLHFSLFLLFETKAGQESMFEFVKDDFSGFAVTTKTGDNSSLEWYKFSGVEKKKSLFLSKGEFNKAFFIHFFISNSSE